MKDDTEIASMKDEGWIEMRDEGFVELVGPFFQKLDSRGLHFRFLTVPKHRNRRGVLQGGALMTFADRALGTAARQGRTDEAAATMQMDVHFIAPVAIGDCVETVPVVLRTNGPTTYVRADLMVSGKTVAVATGIWKRMPLK